MTENELLINRITDFIAYKNISEREFTRSLNFTSNILTLARKNKGGIGSDKLIKIYSTYPELSADWLLLGRGEMLKKESSEPIKKETKNLDCEKENLFLLEKIKMLEDKIALLEENNNLLKQLQKKS